jgi:hypothetical protein
MLSALVVMGLIVVGSAVVLVARHLGRRAGMRQTIPWRPIFQLVEHRTRCLGQDPARVQSELGPQLGVPPWAWGELFALRRPLARRGRTAAGEGRA